MGVSNISMLIFHLYWFCLPDNFPISFGALAPSLSVNTFLGFFFSTSFWFYFSLLSFLQAPTLLLCTLILFQRKTITTQPSSQACLLTSNALHAKKTPTAKQKKPHPNPPETKKHHKPKTKPNKKTNAQNLTI